MKKKKDILLLCQFFYPEYISSATLPFDTAAALAEQGWSVGALCGYPKEYAQAGDVPMRECIRGVQIHRVKYLQMSRSNILGRLVNYLSLTVTMLLHLAQIGSYETVIVYSNPPLLPWVASWAKKLFGTKLVFVAYDLYPEIAVRTGAAGEKSLICRVMNFVNKRVFRRADRVVALSEEMREFILANRPISPDKVTVIPNWYDDLGTPGPVRQENVFRPVTKGRFTVSYFGNMGTAQDLQTIIDAIRALKGEEDLCFLFAGHGNKIPLLRRAIEEDGLTNVYLYDFLHGQEFQDALQISDCALVALEPNLTGLCVPSKTYSYMMQGIPLLAVMDRSDIVRDIERGAGRWVRNGESRALADAIRTMKADPEGLKQMRKTCREVYLEKYTADICTRQYGNLIRELLET